MRTEPFRPKKLKVAGSLLVFIFLAAASFVFADSRPGEKQPVRIGDTKYKERLIQVFDGFTVRLDATQAPVYPARLKEREVNGVATLMIIVDEKGKAIEVGLMSSTPDPAFGPAAIEAARKWKYYPMLDDQGKPMMYGLRYLVTFKITTLPGPTTVSP